MVINPIVGVYIPILRIPIKGGMTIPKIATFDHRTYKRNSVWQKPRSPKTPVDMVNSALKKPETKVIQAVT